MLIGSTKSLLFGILLVLVGGIVIVDSTSSLPFHLEAILVLAGALVGLVSFLSSD